MLRWSLNDLKGSIGHIDVITTDVFDTLLLRKFKSQRSRLVIGEEQFARFLKTQDRPIAVGALIRARLLAEELSYRALNFLGQRGEVRLVDVISRQLHILGLSQSLVERRLAIELAVEKRALYANGKLAMVLRHQRTEGVRIIALSDTGLPGEQLTELINHFHGPGLLDGVYSSADIGLSKRQGDLFSFALDLQGVSASRTLHIGDDYLADCLVPESLGLNTIHVPKASIKRLLSKTDGAIADGLRRIRYRRLPPTPCLGTDDPISFGRAVFGPILAEFCLFLWLFCQQVADCNSDATMLFCARGGIGIREAFERFQRALGLPLPLRRENLLVSRLVAARAAVAARSPDVLDELSREFNGSSFAMVANALGGSEYNLPAAWQELFHAGRFFEMLEDECAKCLRDDIGAQNALFEKHLGQVTGDNQGLILLCDTGLYGSTQKLLAAGLPEWNFKTVQFARCNYKGLSEDHFPDVAGLVVEDRFYNPLKLRTVVLRYWQIIESLFEPSIASVRYFDVDETGKVIANSGDITYGKLDTAVGNPLLSGALEYLDSLAAGGDFLLEAGPAWLRLKQAITNPADGDLVALGIGPRSVDFGRAGFVHAVPPSKQAGPRQKLARIRSHLWREGAIARDFPRSKPILLSAIELAHVVRGVSARLHRSP
jgi:FMN phosphatase YigB (HAD superfamily)